MHNGIFYAYLAGDQSSLVILLSIWVGAAPSQTMQLLTFGHPIPPAPPNHLYQNNLHKSIANNEPEESRQPPSPPHIWAGKISLTCDRMYMEYSARLLDFNKKMGKNSRPYLTFSGNILQLVSPIY